MVVSLRGPQRRIGLVARVDLVAADTTATALTAHVVADGADAALVIAYTDDTQHAHGAAVILDDALHAAGIAAVGVWWVTATDYRCAARRGGRPREVPRTSETE